MTLMYLASPFTGTIGEQKERTQVALTALRNLTEVKETTVFSPLQHHKEAALESQNYDLEFWMTQNLAVLDKCETLIVLTSPGWNKSVGVAMELGWAIAKGMPILLMDPDTWELAPYEWAHKVQGRKLTLNTPKEEAA